jgi:hypothetical protein
VVKASIDEQNGKMAVSQSTKDLAVYFNKEGFNKYRESAIEADLGRQGITAAADITAGKTDTISLLPTGYSGALYNYHDGSGYHLQKKLQDTYELTVMLPSIGTAISEM